MAKEGERRDSNRGLARQRLSWFDELDLAFGRVMQKRKVPLSARPTIYFVIRGYGYKTIARKRDRALRTVKKHVAQAFARFSVHDREDLAATVWHEMGATPVTPPRRAQRSG